MKRLWAVLLYFIATTASADIRLIVPYSPGGVADKIAREVQQQLSSNHIGIVIEYKNGAGGAIAFNYVASQKNNETILLLASNGITDGPLINSASNYNLSTDFINVKHLGNTPMVLVVSKNSTALTFDDLVKQSKIRTIFYGSSGVGSGQHISAAIVTAPYKNFKNVPYKGGSQALVETLSGTIDFLMESSMIVDTYIDANQLKPLAVLSPARLDKYPKTPTFRELGINDYGYTRWFMLVANKSANLEEIKIIQDDLNSAEFTQKLEKLGLTQTHSRNANFLTQQAKQFQKIHQNVKFD